MSCPHFSFRRGQRVVVLFKGDKEKLVGKYHRHNSKYVFVDKQKIAKKDVRAVVIFR